MMSDVAMLCSHRDTSFLRAMAGNPGIEMPRGRIRCKVEVSGVAERSGKSRLEDRAVIELESRSIPESKMAGVPARMGIAGKVSGLHFLSLVSTFSGMQVGLPG